MEDQKIKNDPRTFRFFEFTKEVSRGIFKNILPKAIFKGMQKNFFRKRLRQKFIEWR